MRARFAALVAATAFAIAFPNTSGAAEPDLAALIEASRAATVEGPPTTLPDGSTLRGRFLPPAPATAPFVPPAGWPAPIPPQPGRAIPVPGEERPLAIQPLADGRILLGTEHSLLLIDPASTTPTRSIRDTGARLILPNEDGTKLLITTTGEPPILILDAVTLSTVTQLDVEKKGAFAWWGEGANEIMLTREAIDFRGDTEKRIFLLVSKRTTASGAETELGWPIDFFASVGTVAPLGISWGVRSQPGQVNPIPGPLLALENGKLRGPLTTTERWADIQPAGGSDGHLYWIRTRERGTPTGRLMTRDAREPDSPERQLSAEPTWLVGTTADGARVAWVTGASTAGPWSLRTATRAELDAVDSGKMAAADARIEVLWTSAARKLRAEFATTSAGRAAIGEGPALVLAEAPSWDVVEAMGIRLRELVSTSFDLPPLAANESAIPRADFLLSHATGFMHEEPPEILAVAGLFVQEARRARIGTTLPGAVDKSLASSVGTWAWSDGLTCILASPYRIARDRISSGLRLGEALDGLRTNSSLPVFHVDGFDVPTRILASGFLAGVAGVADAEPSVDDAARALGDFPDCDICALSLARNAADAGRAELALEGAATLARRHPASPEAFAMLSDALLASNRPDEARAAMDWAVELDPVDVMIRMRSTTLWIILSDAERARADYDALVKLPGAEALEDHLASRKRMIDALEANAAP